VHITRGVFIGQLGLYDGMRPHERLEPMELRHLPYRKATYEDYIGVRGLKRHGKKRWRKYVADVVKRVAAALQPDDIVLGGGNVKLLKPLPKGCRQGDNANAFVGGFRLWTTGNSTGATVRLTRTPRRQPSTRSK
jgi:polyphosphate glucokinase